MARDQLKLLKSAVQVVTFLLAAFGGYLRGIAPPEETGVGLVLGLASFLCLIGFLLITALAPSLPKRYWLIAAAVTAVSLVIAVVVYQQQLGERTFVWSPTGKMYVAGGDQLTPKAAEARRQDPSLKKYDLVAGFGGIDESRGIDKRTAVWPEAAIQSAGRTLTLVYVWTVLSAAIGVFCAAEGASRPPEGPSGARPRRKKVK